jgi:hypothetical protein
LSKATFVNPDEWIGLGAGHPEAYRTYLERELTFDTNIALPDGDCADPVSAPHTPTLSRVPAHTHSLTVPPTHTRTVLLAPSPISAPSSSPILTPTPTYTHTLTLTHIHTHTHRCRLRWSWSETSLLGAASSGCFLAWGSTDTLVSSNLLLPSRRTRSHQRSTLSTGSDTQRITLEHSTR